MAASSASPVDASSLSTVSLINAKSWHCVHFVEALLKRLPHANDILVVLHVVVRVLKSPLGRAPCLDLLHELRHPHTVT